MAHGAVPLDSTDHEVLDVHHASAAGFHGDDIEAFANQTVTRYKRNLLTLGEGAGLTCQRRSQGQEEEDPGEHRRTNVAKKRERLRLLRRSHRGRNVWIVMIARTELMKGSGVRSSIVEAPTVGP